MVKTKSTRDMWIDLCLLSVTVYSAIFLHFRSFGIYEDDLTRLTPNFDTLAEFRRMLMWSFAWTERQGHPLHDIFVFSFAFLGWRMGGLAALYSIGIAILVLNAALVYFLLQRISNERLFALAGALTFCLYPADTTRAFLNHALGVQISMTFLLIACHLYLSGRRVWSYVFATLVILTYEIFFPVFLAIPLASDQRWNRKTVRTLAKHAVILGAILAADLVARRLLHESRAAGVTVGSVLVGALNGVREGPVAVLSIFIHAPREVLEKLGRVPGLEMAAGFVISCAVFGWALWRYSGPSPSAPPALSVEVNARAFRIAMTPELYRLARLAVLGVAMTILAYPLSLSLAASLTRGRGTRVHAPAALGVAILGGCAVCAALHLAEAYGKKRAVTALAAVSFATLLCVGLTVQADFIEAWKLQKNFWLKFSAVAAHMQDGDVYLVEPIGHTDAIGAFGWNMAYYPESLWRLPKTWKNPPRAFIFDEGWKARYCSGGELFASSGWVLTDLPDVWPAYRDAPPRIKRIALENGRLVQRSSVCGPSTALPIEPGPVPFETKPFYSVLLK